MLKSIFVKQGKDVKCSNKAPCHNSTRLAYAMLWYSVWDHHVASYEKYGYVWDIYSSIIAKYKMIFSNYA